MQPSLQIGPRSTDPAIAWAAPARPACLCDGGRNKFHFQLQSSIRVLGRSRAQTTGSHLVSPSISTPPCPPRQPRAPPVKDTASTPDSRPADKVKSIAASAPAAIVTLSPAAQAAQEAAETPQEAARDARGKDRQAQQLVAKQAAGQPWPRRTPALSQRHIIAPTRSADGRDARGTHEGLRMPSRSTRRHAAREPVERRSCDSHGTADRGAGRGGAGRG